MSSFELFVNGTLMRGEKLHQNVQGARFLGQVSTAPRYRLHTIADVHPGMYAVDVDGVAIQGELYEVTDEQWARIEAGEPEGLYRGRVMLQDEREVWSILAGSRACEGVRS